MRRRPWYESVYDSILMSRPLGSDVSTPVADLAHSQHRDLARKAETPAHRSVASFRRSISLRTAFASSPLTVVPSTESPTAVEPARDSLSPSRGVGFLEAALAAFSAWRFALDADKGGIVYG
jgi:hypothetical protein